MDTSVIEDPQSWNLYSYARNNPLILIDPNGAEPTLVRNAIDYYPVTGASVAEAVKKASAIASAAVGEEVGPGYTTTDFIYQTGGGNTGLVNGEYLSINADVTVTVTVTVHLPEWLGHPDAPEGAVEEFKTDRDQTTAPHEEGHVKIALGGGRELERRLESVKGRGKSAGEADRDRRRKNRRALNQTMSETNQKHKDYDKAPRVPQRRLMRGYAPRILVDGVDRSVPV